MGSLTPLLSLPPISTSDLGMDAWNAHGNSIQYGDWNVPPLNYGSGHLLKFQTDLVNLVEGRVDPSTFTPEYLQQLKNYYRYSATRYPTRSDYVAPRIRDTLELV